MTGPSKADVLRSRELRFGPNYSLSYDDPLMIVRGEGCTLYDESGRGYLDCVNNVCHVGHTHSRVVEAIARQAAQLNTNSRYLHPLLSEYCERLVARFPEPLSVVYLVCSGSEAVDLALRMAYARTEARTTICVDTAYHGHTEALIGISPYKFDGPGGGGCPDTTRVVPLPDVYRGAHRGPDAGPAYARSVADTIEALRGEGVGVADFICEGAISCGGQIVLPDGYLAPACGAVRAAGGVAIVDEIQSGFGRPGSSFWAFEGQDVVPDIVTLGKPIANGHPMGAVVTTREIAEAFDNGMEFFATFGGNPVSCAAGLAVLDVIDDERLQEHARTVGETMLSALRALAERHEAIGDVRGRGLFVGVDLVEDREERTPATELARRVINAMRHRGVLLSTDGPFDNVLKIKPPMVFSEADVETLTGELDTVLSELGG